MRLIFRDLTSPPLSFKCGSVGSALSVVTSTLSGTYNAQQSSNNVAAQLSTQKSENALNRDWQTAEAEKNRQFQEDQTLQAQQFQNEQRLASQQYQSEQWQNQFNQELAHRFDVPSGVNPAVYYSSHGAASGVGGSVSAPSSSAPSPQSGSMPSGVGGLSPVPYQAPRLDFAQMLGAAGSFIENLASAEKQGAETKELMGTLTSKIRTAIANADTAEVANNLQALNYQLQQGKFPIELKRAAAEYENIVRDGLLTEEKTLSERYNQDLIQATERLQDAMSELNNKQAERLGLEMPYVVQFMTSQIQDKLASAKEHRSSAALSDASAEQIKFYNDLRKDPAVRRSLCEELIELGKQAQNKTLISDREYKHLDWQIEQLKKATSNYEIQMWSGIINQTLGTVANTIGEVTRFGLAKKFLSGSKGELPPPMEYFPGSTTRGQSW